jgi:hypothetical protein
LDSAANVPRPASAVFDLASPVAIRLAGALAADPSWRLAYFDRAGAVFLRANGQPSAGLDVAGRGRALAAADDSTPAVPHWLGGQRLPYPSFNLAQFLSAIGRPDLAVDEALRLWPLTRSEEIAVVGGQAAQASGRLVEFLGPLEDANADHPDSTPLRTLLFLALAFRSDGALNRGALGDAERDLRRMTTLEPASCGPYLALAKVAALRRDAATAVRLLAEGRRYDRDRTCERSAAADPVLRSLRE